MDRAEQDLRRAAEARASAQDAARIAASNLAAAITVARNAGISITRIAAIAGLSRQGVYDFLKRDG